MINKDIAILGAGSWGTALALYLARQGQTVRIWSIDTSEIEAMLLEKAHHRYLPGIPLPDSIHPHRNLAETVKEVDDILVVVPSIGFRQTLTLVKPFLHPRTRIICATKGIDAETGQLLNQVADDVIGQHPYAVLSGPSFAREVAAGLPAAVVIASRDAQFLSELKQRFHSDIFAIHPSHDIIGVEVGGVVKNVIAIATGIADGLGLGTNTRSALITLGLAEITQLGSKLGGKAETFLGLSGLGDLILTCSDDQSRNRRLGLHLGKGASISQAETEIGQVIEGKRNAELVAQLAKQHDVHMPICEMVWRVVSGDIEVKAGEIRKMILGLLG